MARFVSGYRLMAVKQMRPARLALIARASLACLILMGGASCTRVMFITAGDEGERTYLSLETVRARNTALVRQPIGQKMATVHFAPGEEALAATTLERVERAHEYVVDQIGYDPMIAVTYYLYPWPAEQQWPSYNPPSSGHTAILFYPPGQFLTSSRSFARHELHESLVHELIIRHLPRKANLRGPANRWLIEGVAEALAHSYGREIDPQYWKIRDIAFPHPLALTVADPLEWGDRDLKRSVRNLDENFRLAFYLFTKEVSTLAAARALVVRWFEAAQRQGSARPAAELIRQLQAQPTIDAYSINRIAAEQTGLSLSSLAEISASELDRLRHEAWSHRNEETWENRIHAFGVLQLAGLPEQASTSSVDEAAWRPLPPETPAWAEELFHEARIAMVSQTGNRDSLERLAGWVRMHPTETYRLQTLALLWEAYAGFDRQAGLQALCTILGDDSYALHVQEKAADAVQRLTGQPLGWTADAAAPESRRALEDCQSRVGME